MTNYIIKTNSLSKHYGNFAANENISVGIKKGSIYGLVGRNGAGKTTFMKMICSLSSPTSGGFELCGVRAVLSESCGSAGCVGHPALLAPDLAVLKNFWANTHFKMCAYSPKNVFFEIIPSRSSGSRWQRCVLRRPPQTRGSPYGRSRRLCRRWHVSPGKEPRL